MCWYPREVTITFIMSSIRYIVFINWTITLIIANIRQIASSPMCIHSCILSSLIPVMGLVGLVSLSGKRR